MDPNAQKNTLPPSARPPASRLERLWAYTKHIAHDDELFIQSTAIKGGGVVAVMIGALYMIPAAAGLPFFLAAGVASVGAVVIGVGAAGMVLGAGALNNSVRRIIKHVNGQHDTGEPQDKKITLDEARQGLQKKFVQSPLAQRVRSWRVSQYIGKTHVWKTAMKNWNRSQSFIADNGIFIKSFAVAGSAANIAAGVVMLASGTVLFPLILGGAATIATVGVAVGSIGWGLAAAYVLLRNTFGGKNKNKEVDATPKKHPGKKENRRQRRLAAQQARKATTAAPLPQPATAHDLPSLPCDIPAVSAAECFEKAKTAPRSSSDAGGPPKPPVP